jgi:hypothetical protein
VPAIVGEARGETVAEVYNNNRANYGAKKSDEEYSKNTKYCFDDLFNHDDFSLF